MDRLEQRLRDELQDAASTVVPVRDGDPAYRRVRRRAGLRRAGGLSLAATGLVTILAAVVLVPGYLGGGQGPTGGRPPASAPEASAPAEVPMLPEIPMLPADTRSELSYRVAPATGPPGTTVTISGSGCPSPNGGAVVEANLLLTGELNGQSEFFRAGSDGTFEGEIEVRSPLLPNLYQVVLFCTFEGSGSGAADRVGFGKTFTVTAAPAGGSTGTPDPAGFTASLRRGDDGKLLLEASGTGCFLERAGGVPGGLVVVGITRPGEGFDGDALDFGLFSADAEVAGDGTWRVEGVDVGGLEALRDRPPPRRETATPAPTREAAQPAGGPLEVHAACVDALYVAGFGYERAYRLDLDAGRLEALR